MDLHPNLHDVVVADPHRFVVEATGRTKSERIEEVLYWPQHVSNRGDTCGIEGESVMVTEVTVTIAAVAVAVGISIVLAFALERSSITRTFQVRVGAGKAQKHLTFSLEPGEDFAAAILRCIEGAEGRRVVSVLSKR